MRCKLAPPSGRFCARDRPLRCLARGPFSRTTNFSGPIPPLEVNELPFRRELLDQIELITVGSEHRQTCLGCRQIDERIVEAFLALVPLKALRAGQHASHDTGIAPDL